MGAGERVMRRWVAASMAVVLAVALGVAIVSSSRNSRATAGAGIAGQGAAAADLLVVRGISGSEKIPFLTDQRVVDRLRVLGLDLQVNSAGSRQIATEAELDTVDFVFPAGAPAAAGIEAKRPASASFTPFVSPMAIASWRPVVDALAAAGVAVDRGDHWELSLDGFLALFDSGRRWNEIGFPSENRVMISTTDVRQSNSAAMYLALVSYTRNGHAIVSDRATADRLVEIIWPLFAQQGFLASSSQLPFDAFLVRGPGAVPLVLVYEAQFIAEAAADPSPITSDMVLLYPTPNVFSTHTLLAYTDAGRALGEALSSDAELQALATEHGFRVDDASFRGFAAEHGLQVPGQIVDTVEPPTYEVLEYMIAAIESRYEQ